jgi:hypothetical protein
MDYCTRQSITRRESTHWYQILVFHRIHVLASWACIKEIPDKAATVAHHEFGEALVVLQC